MKHFARFLIALLFAICVFSLTSCAAIGDKVTEDSGAAPIMRAAAALDYYGSLTQSEAAQARIRECAGHLRAPLEDAAGEPAAGDAE